MKYSSFLFSICLFATFVYLLVLFNYGYESNHKIAGFLLDLFQIETKINACILILTRNSDLSKITELIQQFEKIFNKKQSYPYVLFNDEPFTNEFKYHFTTLTNASVDFELIDKSQWSVPEWINAEKLNASLRKIKFSLSYRFMCRFFSGFFFRQNSTLKYDYYMRLDTDSRFCQPLELDPFRTLVNLNKTYGYIVSDLEAIDTIGE